MSWFSLYMSGQNTFVDKYNHVQGNMYVIGPIMEGSLANVRIVTDY